MPIEFRCGQCQQLLRVPDDSAGKSARCPKCQALMVVPNAAAGPHAPAPEFGAQLPAATFAPLAPAEGNAPAANPFGEAASAPLGDAGSLSTNPYASPAGAAYAYGTQLIAGPRPGLPWETDGPGFVSWWETTKLVMLQPSYAFSIMKQHGGPGNPMFFACWGQALGFAANMVWLFPTVWVFAAANQRAQMALGLQLGLQAGVQFALAVLVPTVFLFFIAAIWHLSLKIVGGANHPYETTYRVLAFSSGSFPWLNIIPVVGPLVAIVWIIVANIIGMANGQQCEGGKAVAAFFVTIVLSFCICFAAYLGIVGLVIAIIAATRGLQ